MSLRSIKIPISSELMSKRNIAPFWMEGLQGLAWGRITGITTPNLGQALADILAPWLVDINWNTNPGYVGWFFVTPWLTPLYLIYTGLLAYVSIYLVKKISSDAMALDMVWLGWCLFLIPGWLASFVLFIESLLVFYLLQVVAAVLCRIRFTVPGPKPAEGSSLVSISLVLRFS